MGYKLKRATCEHMSVLSVDAVMYLKHKQDVSACYRIHTGRD
jgi:hypothetical protein